MRFLLALHVNPQVRDALTADEHAALATGRCGFAEELAQSGEMITAQGLDEPSRAAVVRVRAGRAAVTGGPYLAGTAQLAGFYLIDCEDRARALEIAAQVPDAAVDGMAVEVRPIMFSGGLEM